MHQKNVGWALPHQSIRVIAFLYDNIIIMKDPIVESVREAREEHAKKFNYNLHEICEDLQSKQKDCGHKVVSLRPKRITKAPRS
jgi:hypothetical protein